MTSAEAAAPLRQAARRPASSPAISVVMPTYDRPDGLRRAVSSVLGQTLADFELIVIDDGSRLAAVDSLADLADPRLRCHRQENRGRSAARNVGAARATAEVVTFLDDDDEAEPEWLAELAGPFGDAGVGVVCCGEAMFVDRGGERRREVRLPQGLGPVYDHFVGRFRSGTFALRRELFTVLGGYAEELAFSENTDFALRLLPECRKRGLEVVAVREALVRVYNSRGPGNPGRYRERLDSARYILHHHGQRYRRAYPRGYANYCGIAGVNAARLGLFAESRRFLLDGVRACPRYWRAYGRLLLSFVPSVARRVWLRQADPCD